MVNQVVMFIFDDKKCTNVAYHSLKDNVNCKMDLAFDLSLSALLGDNIYNFGELLAHPIIKSLLGTKVEWLYYILQAFNTGSLVRYEELCRVHNAALRAQSALVENEKQLLEKINILCLMEIIFSRPSEDRTIPLKVIAERTKLSIEDVEHLLMKSLSGMQIIKGDPRTVASTFETTPSPPQANINVGDLLSNALALATVPTDSDTASTFNFNVGQSKDFDSIRWELALVTAPSTNISAASGRQLCKWQECHNRNNPFGAYHP
ncbi:26S proteasome non-ATPase regulatory subunit 13 homolog A-like [Hibiscus syriacus]|uniref:26S proteasome non-ATPase regulatory subunit 13 homolog A-like n=1 Tax=Hibiscus syriacus TaxID=106335 RepID=UPI0019215449|nr:26S proteasome non-ATPase regulatory subunit 13 homolog A-like [Hibiscus syriacus]